MKFKCIRGVVSSKGALSVGDLVELPDHEAAVLMAEGKLVPHDEPVIRVAEAPVIENRDPVVRRGRKPNGR